MTKKEIATLSFKMLSLYAFISAIDKLPRIFYSMSHNDLRGPGMINFVMAAVPPLLLVICGMLLWFMAPLLAVSIFKSTVSENEPNASFVDIQTIAFSVAGLYVLASALPNLVESVSMYYIIVSHTTEGGAPLGETIIVLMLKIALGFWLFFGSRSIVKFIRSRQHRGHP